MLMLIVTTIATLAADASMPCREDPLHTISDTWTCDNPQCVCTCPDGSVIPVCESEEKLPTEPAFEATIVRLAVGVALIFGACFGAVCFFMCVRGGSKNAAMIVREMEEADAWGAPN
jgi:hypothetical protein